jgi:hypothetical protein
MTDVNDRLATAEDEIAANEGNIESQGNDIASLKLRMKDAEEDIADNANGIKDNAEDITDLDRRLDSIESWYNNVGSKFSKDTDGTIKMDGDFYTTGENSAGGVGESVGGSGGGIDTDELDSILDKKGYATEDWVNDQGFAKGTIPTRVSQLTNDKGYVTASDIPSVPTRVSQLENDAKYLASITADMVKSALGYAPFSAANFTKLNIKNTLGISDWALAASKPTYSYGEIANTPDMSGYVTTGTFNAALKGKVDAVSGKGLSTNDYTTAEKNRVASIGSLGFKDSLAFSELKDKPTTLKGYGITDDIVLASNIGEHTAGKAKQLAVKRKIWGQDFDGTKDINGNLLLQGDIGRVTDSLDYNWRIASIIDGAQLQVGWQDASSYNGNFYFTGMYGAALNLFNVRSNHSYFDGETVVFRNTGLTQFNAASTFNGGAKIASGQPLSFLDSNGTEHKITYDEASQAFKIDGDLFTTGETSAGGKGSEAFDLASVLDRIAALESNAAKNLVINFTLLSSNIGESKLQTVLDRIGFTTDVVNGLLDAKYNKVVGNGTYKEVWNYTAHETASYIEIYLRKGDGNVVGEWYNLFFSKSTGRWNIIFGEI